MIIVVALVDIWKLHDWDFLSLKLKRHFVPSLDPFKFDLLCLILSAKAKSNEIMKESAGCNISICVENVRWHGVFTKGAKSKSCE